MSRRCAEEEWVARAREQRGDRYIYAGCGYRGMSAPVAITCPVHGPFKQRAQDHILARARNGYPDSANGCPCYLVARAC